MLFILLLPIGGFFIYGNFIQKDVYGETYYAELKEKVERLKNVEEKKIVFIGGSSLIFGLRSEEIEKSTGYKVIDFGLYASLGTSLMINLAEPYIKKDDVVILAPEINEQTYSNYIGYEAALKCFENMNYPINRFDPNENMKFFFHYFRYVIDKGNAKIELTAPYDKASFLPFYALGDHNNYPLIECFGQDNSGLYVDGNNITINDINMKNCDFSNSLGFLDYVGTVIDIHGDNNTIVNSRISNGKNVIRAFSTNNLEINNSLISNARNFLLYAGSNEYTKPNENKEYEFTLYDGSKVTSTISEFFKKDGLGDQLLTQYVSGEFDDWLSMYQAISSTQKALCDDSDLYDSSHNLIYKGSIDINDTFFYRSGVSSIGLDTMFDGAYLYSSLPSIIDTYLGKLETQKGNKLSNLLTKNTAGQAYPVEVNINGMTRFYDYKETDNIDISGLIAENMTGFAHAYDPNINVDINIDKIFPIKEKIISQAEKQGSVYSTDEKNYVCCAIAYYGGGNNYNKVTVDGSEIESHLNKEIKIDLLSEYVKIPKTTSATTQVKYLMQKTVTAAIGYSPFKFVCTKNDGYLFNESPNVRELRNN